MGEEGEYGFNKPTLYIAQATFQTILWKFSSLHPDDPLPNTTVPVQYTKICG